MIKTFVMIFALFFGMATQVEARVHTVQAGETLSGIAGNNWKAVCTMNHIEDCDKIDVGQKIVLPESMPAQAETSRVKQSVRPVVSKQTKSAKVEAQCIQLGADPYNAKNAMFRAVDGIKALTTLTDVQKDLAVRMYMAHKQDSQFYANEIQTVPVDGRVFAEMLSGSGSVVKHTYQKPICAVQGESMETYDLGDGVYLAIPEICGNPSVFISEETSVESEIEIVEEPIPEPEEEMIFPVHAEESKSELPCDLQAGVGVYANSVYRGAWGYAEGLCYVFKHGEWQHGPGFYVMGGGGESLTSTYSNTEYGLGLQYGLQHNFINERNFPSTFEVKARWLPWDHMEGSNDEGYFVEQDGQKLGVYGSYYEKHGDKLFGLIGEAWWSFDESVESSWSGQQAQDRGTLGVFGLYEHALGESENWRLRWILGWQYTNWDSQNWLRFIPEFRYHEWLMIGPQLSLPLGISDANVPLNFADLVTIGAFIRVELGNIIRNIDADHREGQLEFIPADQ